MRGNVQVSDIRRRGGSADGTGEGNEEREAVR